MTVRVVFRDFAETWEEEISSQASLTCAEAAAAALERRGKTTFPKLNSVVYMAEGRRLDPRTPLSDGAVLTVAALVGGG